VQVQITLPYQHSQADLETALRHRFGADIPYRILKRSIDARQHRNIRVTYSVTTDTHDPAADFQTLIARQKQQLQSKEVMNARPVVVGTGPAGIFCAYWLRLHGFTPVMLEQGPPMMQRIRDMARFMKQGDLHPWSNICFGAGGAGTYSDGKLITRIRSPFISFVMQTFVDHGAPEEIRYLYNPHLGSNKIRQCIKRLLDSMEESGITIHYNTRFTGYRTSNGEHISGVETHDGQSLDCHALFLATGHSARDVYRLLRHRQAQMSLKEFAIGVRVEHPAVAINQIQYGPKYRELYGSIETAQYRLASTWKEEARAVYSFCMCPGGYVLNASTDSTGVVTNGMSNYRKSGRFSNSAIVVNVSAADLAERGYDGIDGGLALQSELEATFRASVNTPGSSHIVPGQRLQDFLQGESSSSLLDSSCLNPVAPSAMHKLFPEFMYSALRKGFTSFDRKMRGFSSHERAQVFGLESRTSSPYRIDRDRESLRSPSHPNLYPIGEGAGYAGGITSAAVDGIRAAQAYIQMLTGVEGEEMTQKSKHDSEP